MNETSEDVILPETGWRFRIALRMSQWLRTSGRIGGLAGRFLSPLRMLIESTLLGIALPAQIQQLVHHTYDQSVDFYDPDRYQRRDEERLFPHLRPLAKAGRMRLLDAFCGAGREAKLFAVEGWHVTAFDGNAGMIDAARQQSADEEHRIHYLTCDFDAFETDEPFDIVYTSLWMYSTVQTPGKRDAFLRRCLDWVSDEGVVVISIVSDRQDHRVSAGLRFLVSRLVGLCTLGNARVQWGERFYDGLFWHHLDDQTVRQEITRARGTVTQVVPGDGITPNFYIFQSSTRKQAPTTERAA